MNPIRQTRLDCRRRSPRRVAGCVRLFLALVVISAGLGANITARAEDHLPNAWQQKNFTYVAEEQEIAEVLNAMGATLGLSVVVSPDVHGTISGTFTKVSPREFLTSVAAAHGLVWYCDGTGLYVYNANEVKSFFICLDYMTPDEALDLVKKLGLYDSRFALRSVTKPPMIHVVGPPRYIEDLSFALTAAEAQLSRREVRQEEVRLFALKHAWADDIRLPLREGEVTVPGVASTLRRLMVLRDESSYTPREITAGPKTDERGDRSAPFVKQLPGHLDNAASGGGAAESGVETQSPSNQQDAGSYGSTKHMQNQLDPDIRPSIEADMRRNAVIIRDSAARMKLYEDLIRQMDIPVRLVEIQASILDVDADLAFEWGLDNSLSFQDQHNDGSVNMLTPPASVVGGAIGNKGAIEASWLLLNDHLRFLTVVRALEGKGQARILSRPSLITFANLEAELRDDQTYNVRVSGERVADLVSVTAGVQLRVTANVIDPPAGEEGSPPGIQLLVHIEDGSFEAIKVDELPIVRTSAINTQAVVGHGQSLLVGGYLKDSNETNERNVPVVSKIPVIGALFQSRERKHQIMQRMFLLTPRMVELDAAMGLDPLENTKRLEAEKRLFNLLDQQVKGSFGDAKPLKNDEPSPKRVRGKKPVFKPAPVETGAAPAAALKDVVIKESVPKETAPALEVVEAAGVADNQPELEPVGAVEKTKNFTFRKAVKAQ